ncbi:MAG TPA: hypothetical protein VD913_02670 [bacterium]|nr:hypothetical protein [bacterium]
MPAILKSMRWLVLDEVLAIERKVRASARSHVPSSPFSPEILIIEMMAQTGALLLGAESDFKEDLVFAKIEKAAFATHFEKNQTLFIEAHSEALRTEGAWIEGSVNHEDSEIGRARFLLMNIGHLIPGKEEPVTFHHGFMDHFRIREKIK